MSDEGELFSERQQLSPRLQAFVYASIAIAGLGAYVATRDAPGAEIGLYIVTAVLVLVAILFQTFTLTTTVVGDGLKIRGMWFVNRKILFSDIEKAEMRQYRPLVEYGGWGYRIGPSGKAYNAQGDEGVQLVLKGGGRVLIGSQRAMELANIITTRIGDRALKS